MSMSAAILMVAVWSVIITLCVFCFYKVFSKKDRNK
jgi:hypothetical protein